MTDIRTQLAEAQREHQWRKYDDRCRCGNPGTYDEHPAHLADVLLALPDIAIVRKLGRTPESPQMPTHQDGDIVRIACNIPDEKLNHPEPSSDH